MDKREKEKLREQLLNTAERELNVLKKWFNINKLSLNLSKRKFMIFDSQQINNQVKIMINDVGKKNSRGVIIDHKLC